MAKIDDCMAAIDALTETGRRLSMRVDNDNSSKIKELNDRIKNREKMMKQSRDQTTYKMHEAGYNRLIEERKQLTAGK